MSFLLPYLGSAVAGYVGSKLGSKHKSSSHPSSKSKGSKYSYSSDSDIGQLIKFPTMTHGQKKLLKKGIKQVDFKDMDIYRSPYYKAGGDLLKHILKTSPEEQYAPFQNVAMRQFNEEIIPELTNRFSSLGASQSSAFNQAMGAAGANLSERLAMLREGLKSDYQGRQLEAAKLGLNYAQQPASNMASIFQGVMGMQPFGFANIPPAQPYQGPSGMSSIFGGVGQGLASGFAQKAGSAGWDWLSSLFK